MFRSGPSILAAGAAVGGVLMIGVAATPPDPSSGVAAYGPLGCSSRPEAEAVGMPLGGVALDGEVVYVFDRGEASNVLERDGMPAVADIEAIDIVCWAAAERVFGVQVRSGVSSIWTYDPFDGGREFLREAYAHVLAGGDVSELEPPDPDLTISLEGQGADGQFHLDLRHPQRRLMCIVSTSGRLVLPGDEPRTRAATEPGEPYCTSLHDHGGSGA